jgi:predicted amidohydrolase
METGEYILGMGQILVEGGDTEGNLARATRMIYSAAERGCRIVVLPECLDIGWTFPTAADLAQPIPGTHSEVLMRAASDVSVYVVAGLTERSDGRTYNAAILISPEGEILLKHRKINELDIAQDLYATGKSLRVIDTPLGTLGVNICADNFPNSLALAHAQARMGCQVLLSPSSWAVDHDHDNVTQPYGDLWYESYTTLAKLYDMTVVGVSNVGWLRGGPWKGRKCIGCSLAVGPGGRVLAQGPYGSDAESLILVSMEVRPNAATGTAIAEVLTSRGYVGP